jgi:methionyl-tRNA formyltransferase
MPPTTRIVFMGTPEFALPTLQTLVDRYPVVGVVTQPDRPAGRGRSLQPPPVKQAALAHDLAVYQPQSLRTKEALQQLQTWAPDVIVTAATGHILTPAVLAVPSRGTLNVHASLLPRWRGAAPIQAAILAGDRETGVTIMCTDKGLDTGPILSQKAIPIAPRETAASLHDKLAQLGAELLRETMPRWLEGEIIPRPQPEQGITVAGRIHKKDGQIDWTRSAKGIDRQIRAYTPWPGAFTFWKKRRLQVIQAIPLTEETLSDTTDPPGTVIMLKDLPAVVTGRGLLRLDQVKLSGKQAMPGAAFIRGRADFVGSQLGTKSQDH